MGWRPPSTRHNPLLALRRVVEGPGPDDLDVPEALAARRGEHLATVRVATLTDVRPAGGMAPAGGAGPAESPAPPEDSPMPADDRPPRGVVTSTPGADDPALPLLVARTAPLTHGPGEPTRPARGVAPGAGPSGGSGRGPAGISSRADRPAPERRDPAGPWSTSPGAPLTTPTWLRWTPRDHGPATASATGRSATVASLDQLAPPEDRAARRPVMFERRARWEDAAARSSRPKGTRPPGPSRPLPVRPARRPDPGTGTSAPRRAMTAAQVLTAMVVCLGLWLVIFTPTLYRNARAS
ncbi:MAG: hypothetical protein JO244_09850, partial [Solirubrobacterales bacterium]|nr:hypothetical protein [Solirubrobacterales bacterium]